MDLKTVLINILILCFAFPLQGAINPDLQKKKAIVEYRVDLLRDFFLLKNGIAKETNAQVLEGLQISYKKSVQEVSQTGTNLQQINEDLGSDGEQCGRFITVYQSLHDQYLEVLDLYNDTDDADDKVIYEARLGLIRTMTLPLLQMVITGREAGVNMVDHSMGVACSGGEQREAWRQSVQVTHQHLNKLHRALFGIRPVSDNSFLLHLKQVADAKDTRDGWLMGAVIGGQVALSIAFWQFIGTFELGRAATSTILFGEIWAWYAIEETFFFADMATVEDVQTPDDWHNTLSYIEEFTDLEYYSPEIYHEHFLKTHKMAQEQALRFVKSNTQKLRNAEKYWGSLQQALDTHVKRLEELEAQTQN